MSGTVKLLVSVRDATEAADALAGGADWIDLKEPRRGALGAVDAETAREVVARVEAQAPVSAAGGEMTDLFDRSTDAGRTLTDLLSVRGISYVKLGLSRCAATDWRTQWRSTCHKIEAANKSLVAVIYSDSEDAQSPPAEEVIEEAANLGCAWLLWDTFVKGGPPIDQQVSPLELRRQLTRARAAGMQAVVAGRLNASSLQRLPLELIDMVAVRGAVCRTTRDSAVCPRLTQTLRDAIGRHTDCRAISR